MNPALASVGVGAVVIGLAVLVGPPRSTLGESVSLTVAGSETVRPLVAACIESYTTKNPRAAVTVQGGGSAQGIAAVIDRRIDIGMASRPPNARERELASARGVELVMYELALDGVAVIVHRSNPVDALDLDQLRRVFSGEIVRWTDLGVAAAGRGGAASAGLGDDRIVPVARAPGSGTGDLFDEQVLAGTALGPATRRVATNEAIVADVASEPGAIGYTSLDALKQAEPDAKVVGLRGKREPTATTPTADTLRSRTYPLTRVLYLVGSAPRSSASRDFMAHCTGPANAAMLKRTGHVAMHAGLL
ncbi:MAG: hypothetical protein AD742_04565 [Methylibium sp. NZG]|nr:MAG: hypothetical protein AD742_04565 [Methylibium sp. NZG]